MDHSAHDLHHMSDMSGMDMAGMDMGSMEMPMVFTLSQSTTLFAHSWTPSTPAAYAGTCIFLALLSVLARGLSAIRMSLEHHWCQNEHARSRGVVQDAEGATLVADGNKSGVVVAAQAHGSRVQPWRWSTDLPRATIFLIQALVGYLLMLAVMTLNVGYFLSVLAGLFVGELAMGRFCASEDGHC